MTTAPAPRRYAVPAPAAMPAIVLCLWPVQPPGVLKARPALLLRLAAPDDAAQPLIATVCYGTSTIRPRLYPHDFIVSPGNIIEFAQAGLHDPTRFDLAQLATLPYNDEFFVVPAHKTYGNTPQLGFIADSAMPRLTAAILAGAAERKRLGLA